MLGHTHIGERYNARIVWESWEICVASLGSLGSGEQRFILWLEESNYTSLNTFLANTSRNEGGIGVGSKSEAGVELEELPEFQHPFTFKSEHGLLTLRHCSVEMFPENY